MKFGIKVKRQKSKAVSAGFVYAGCSIDRVDKSMSIMDV